MHVFTLLGSIITDGQTDRPTYGRTKPLMELRVNNRSRGDIREISQCLNINGSEFENENDDQK